MMTLIEEELMDSNIPTLKEFFIARNEDRLMEYVLAHKEYARQEINGTKQYLLMQSGIRRIDHLLAEEYAARRFMPPKNAASPFVLASEVQNANDTK
jgi:hypothetical protein